MLRRFTSTAAAFLLLVAMTRVADRVDTDYVSALFFGFFVLELGLFLVGITGTERGYFGPRNHPVNRMFIAFSWAGTVGAVVTMVVQGPAGGRPLWLAVIAGTTMFTGGLAAALLAVSASPWRDLLYSRRFDGERPEPPEGVASASSDPVAVRDEAVHGIPRQQPGGGEGESGA